MDCEFTRRRLVDYLEADDRDRRDHLNPVREHLEACRPCREIFKEMAAMVDHFKSAEYDEPPPEYWESFPRRVTARIGRHKRNRLLSRAASMAAAAGIVLAAGVALLFRTGPVVEPPPESGLEEVLAEASEDELEEILDLYDGESASLTSLAQELQELSGTLEEEAGYWYDTTDGVYALVDLLEPEAQKAFLEELYEELG